MPTLTCQNLLFGLRRNIFWARLAFYLTLINKNEIKCFLKDEILQNNVLSLFPYLI
jgi:hypothetical protein